DPHRPPAFPSTTLFRSIGSGAGGIGPHRSPPLGPDAGETASTKLNDDQSAIWRLISAGSRLARVHVNFTAPRSMTAKLSPSSQRSEEHTSELQSHLNLV